MADAPEYDPAIEARRLLRAARSGALATQSGGQPFASLATPAIAPDGSILLWLSRLSSHTQHLRAEPRCSVLFTGKSPEPNPQTTPRINVTGTAEVIVDSPLKARWLAIHPYAALYADFPDFSFWRISPNGGQLVGGFARAHKISAADLTPDPAAVAAVEGAADGIIAHCNADHADTLALLAGAPGEWTMVAVDVDGCDLAQLEMVRRVHWPEAVADANGVRTALIRLARAARQGPDAA